ncbi:LuxR C-terminal-related transcriptional regulator [Nonomuraea sp. KM90]|uniref:LuxR C-terminal-related transcriptional regulator n=1 Tax=Nonomuraea sp. KM90 TaxID=3457428 RepID=UPI003FCD8786
MLHAVHAAAVGSGVFSGSVVSHLVSRSATQTVIPGLAAREHDALNLVAAGLTNTAIAHRLSLKPKRVRNYSSMVLTRLGVDDRDEALALARAAGLGF